MKTELISDANAYPQLYTGPNIGLRVSAYLVFSFAAVLFFVLLGETESSLYVAVVLAIAAALLVQLSNRNRQGSSFITLFFWLASAHAIFGYWAAGKSVDAIWIGTTADQMFRRSFFVIATTLLIGAFTYNIALFFPLRWALRLGRHVQVSERRLLSVARGFLLLGVACLLYVVLVGGFFPLLASNPGTARYISDDLGPSYQLYDWVLHKGLDLLACSVPLVLVSALLRRKKMDFLIGGIGVVSILVTLQRAYLMSVGVVLLLTIALTIGRFPRKYLIYFTVLLFAYFGSQLLLLNALGDTSDRGADFSAVLTALPEVRDLGWTMWLAGEKRFYGLTFVEPMVLGSNTAPEFVEHYGLGNVTARLIGMPRSETGGLRITLAGEGYLNFGALGCLLVGASFGLLCGWLYHLSRCLLKSQDLASSYLIAILFVWLCFWLYLAGTEATGVLKNGLTFVFLMIFLGRVGRTHKPQTA